MNRWIFTLIVFAALQLSGCATNPVTGKNELSLVSESQELAIGKKQYAPSRQMQGGDYILDPKLTQYVKGVGQQLAKVSDRELPYEFVVLNDSTPNAWALPGGKIAINRGLLTELNSEAELAAVLGHEIVHAAARHGAKGMERGMLLQGAIAVAGVASSNSDYSQLAVGAAAVGANLINQSYSRDAETESDYYGMQYMARAGYDPRAAIDLQETFVRLSEGKEKNWLAGLFASHPPSEARVTANRKTAKSLARGGKMGRDIYHRKTAYIRKVKPAYESLKLGYESLKKKAYKQALRSADKALKIEPKEALFYGLKGDVYKAQKRHRLALRNYDKAVQLNPGYFKYYLKRGEAFSATGQKRRARKDFEQSIELLPTAGAHYALGVIAADNGETNRAVQHFRTASSGSSEISQAASGELVRLDLANNPAAYLATSVGVNRGRLVVAVENRTVADVRNLTIRLRRSDGVERSYRQPRVLPAKKILRYTTNIPVNNQRELRYWKASVVKARIAD